MWQFGWVYRYQAITNFLSQNRSAPITATNKLGHRLSTLPVADFSASSNVKYSA